MKRLNPSEYFPRMYRGLAPMESLEAESYVRCSKSLNLLLTDLAAVFHVVEPGGDSPKAFGPSIMRLIFSASAAFEAQCGGILRANGYQDKGRWNTSDYVRLCEPLGLSSFVVGLQEYASYPAIKPFIQWSDSGPTQTIPWFEVYNKLKHQSEDSYHLGTLEVAIEACAAVFILCAAQFGFHHYEEGGRNGQRMFSFQGMYSHPLEEQDTYKDQNGSSEWKRVEYFTYPEP